MTDGFSGIESLKGIGGDPERVEIKKISNDKKIEFERC